MRTAPVAAVPLGMLLLEAAHELQDAETLLTNRARAQLGLRSADYQALQVIAAREHSDTPARPKDLMVVLGVTAAAATMVTDRLAHRDLVRREPDPNDRRGRTLTLTPAARTALAEVFGSFPTDVRHRLSQVSERDVATIRALARDVRSLVDGAVR